MKKCWLGIIAAVVSLFILSCDKDDDSNGDYETIEEAYARLTSEHTITETVWGSRGTPEWIYGTMMLDSMTDNDTVAVLDFLYDYRGLFRMNNPWQELEVRFVTSTGTMAIMSFRQWHHGLLVSGGGVTIMTRDYEKITSIQNYYVDGISVNMEPTLSEEDAWNRFVELSDAESEDCIQFGSFLLIYSYDDLRALAWYVSGSCSEEEGPLDRYIDAHTGDLLAQFSIGF